MRECGECVACCRDLSVTELEKPAYVPCDKLCDKGCSIYEERPDVCRNFHCAWIQGHLGEDDRPDKSGAIVWQAHMGKDQTLTTIVSLAEGRDLPMRILRWLVETVQTNFRIEGHNEAPIAVKFTPD